VYREQGRYADAEAHYQRALAIFEAKLGKDHPNVADMHLVWRADKELIAGDAKRPVPECTAKARTSPWTTPEASYSLSK
jgi:hypothetical protein